MFASGFLARRASVVAAGALILGAAASRPARALEGIQGRHAIFYPSLELVYQHDDNFTLRNTNIAGVSGISAETFIAHAHFKVEVPGARQYVELEYQPQYRSVNVNQARYQLPDALQHFWMLHARLRGSSLFTVDIHHNYTLANLEVDADNGPGTGLDTNRELVKSDARFWSHALSADFKWEGSRQGATVGLGYQATGFETNIVAPPWYELGQVRGGAEYFYKFTPLSRFMVGWNLVNSRQDYTVAWRAIQASGATTLVNRLDSVRNNVYVGFAGELGRTTTGTAKIGFANLNYNAPAAYDTVTDADLLTLSADVTKSFSRYSKLIFEANRDLNFSAMVTKPSAGSPGAARFDTYYVSNKGVFTFSNQPQGSRVIWTVAGAYQRNEYQHQEYHSVGAGTYNRVDDIKMLRAEVGYHALTHLSFRVNYRYEDRDSNDPAWAYTDNIVSFQVQFGF